MSKVALIAGCTGLIGRQLLDLLLTDDRYRTVVAISRRPLSVTNSKLVNVVCELSGLASHAQQLKADDVFCCLGTTIKKAKTKEAFRAVDLVAPQMLAKIAKESGAGQFFFISSLGANKSSSIFYNQVKGEAEDEVKSVGYATLHILRPSLLLGPRQEVRSGEDAAKFIYRFFSFLIPAKYKAIESMQVALAMQRLAHAEQSGTFVHASDQISQFE